MRQYPAGARQLSDASFYPYRAFISYSHADSARCEWLHGKLESYRVPRDLVGRITKDGPVPERLAPVFRDRTDFSTGSLQKQTLDALRQSQFLIVIASPRAAASEYVNEEIRAFKAMGGAGRVCALIAEGVPPDNFPPALRFRVDPDGTITDEKEDVLAGDLSKDGEREALIGLPYDYVWMRDVQAQRKRTIVYAGAGAAFAAAAAAAGVFGWEHFDTTRKVERQEVAVAGQGERIANVEAIVQKLLATQTAQAAPGQREAVRGAVESVATGAAQGDDRLKQALALLKDGKVAEAEPLLRAEAADREKRIAQLQAQITDDRKAAAAAWRNLGAIAGLRDPKKAREAYAKAAELEPDNADGLAWAGWYHLEPGDISRAEQFYTRLLEIKSATDHLRIWALLGLGDIKSQRGQLLDSLQRYREAFSIADRAVKAEPEKLALRRDLSASYERIGNALATLGNIDEALRNYHQGFIISDDLAKTDTDNALWQRDLSVAYERIGDVLATKGDLVEALAKYRNDLAIIERLVKSDRTNTQLQRDLGVVQNKIGLILTSQGSFEEALKNFRASLAIRNNLAQSDPSNTQWQRDVSLSHEKIGEALIAQHKLSEALEEYRDSLSMRDNLAKADPNNALWQRDLSIAYQKIGDVHYATGQYSDALTNYQTELTTAKRLAEIDPSNSQWQSDLSVAYGKVSDALLAQEILPEGLESLRKAFVIADRLARSDDTNVPWQRLLISFYVKLSIADKQKAREYLTKAHDLAVHLKERRRLALTDAWMVEDLARRLSALGTPNQRPLGDN
ncbi:MAG: TIR domain-containing protein [Rhodoblastus sp.]|nr:TIR domain-containing protein [Rhodoblastus sp.]